MTTYTLKTLIVAGVEDTCIERINDDGTISIIPIDPANSDYQAYLRWLENPDADESGTL